MNKCSLDITQKFGWKKLVIDNNELFYKGNILDYQFNDKFIKLLNNIKNKNQLIELLKSFCGQYAFIFHNKSNSLIMICCDRISSIPIYYYKNNSKLIIFNEIDIMEKFKEDNLLSLNYENITEVEMSGFCIDGKTIFNNVFQFEPGECGFIDNNNFNKYFYYKFDPSVKKNYRKDELKDNFIKSVDFAINSLEKISNDRQIVVPISGGHDSRLILSYLHYIGKKNVVCFSYGKKNNIDSLIAQKIAKKLNFKYFEIPTNLKLKKIFFKSKIFNEYSNKLFSPSSITSVQDIYEIYYIKKNNLVQNNAIFVNGNTGDFITGGHLPNFYLKNNKNEDYFYKNFINKHYSLWENLKNKNFNFIKNLLKDFLLSKYIPNKNKDLLYFESNYLLEFYGRQTKYIIKQQRAYDFFGYDWYMPLWNEKFVNFWQSVDIDYKIDQNIYKKMLIEINWSNVWKNIPVNPYKFEFSLVNIVKILFKSIFFPFGSKFWHFFKNRYFKYWTDKSSNYGITNYSNIVRDKDNHRNYISWVQRLYIEEIKRFYEKN